MVKVINKQKKGDSDRSEYAQKLKSIIDFIYDDYGKRTGMKKIPGMDINQGNLAAFVNALATNRLPMARYLSDSVPGTDPKIDAIENVKNGRVTLQHIDNESLYKIMLFYEAAKVVRNQMNHATGADEAGKDNRNKLEYLKENNIDAGWELSSVTALLREGVGISREAALLFLFMAITPLGNSYGCFSAR